MALDSSSRPLGKLVAFNEGAPATALFICDIQERFRETISGYPAVIDTARRLVRAHAHTLLPLHRDMRCSDCGGSGTVAWRHAC